MSQSARPQITVMPPKAKWIRDEVVAFEPDHNRVRLGDGGSVAYEFLVVAVGIELDFARIKGLPAAFGTPGVCSNYSKDTVERTWPAITSFEKGNAIFTVPETPIKCAGAPQKIMYLADAYFRQVAAERH